MATWWNFIISETVFMMMRNKIRFSKGADVTRRHIWNLQNKTSYCMWAFTTKLQRYFFIRSLTNTIFPTLALKSHQAHRVQEACSKVSSWSFVWSWLTLPLWQSRCKTSGSCPCRPQAPPRQARWRWRWSRQRRCWQRRRERQRRRRCRILSAQFCTTGLVLGPHRLTTLNLGVCCNRCWSKMID